jgi:hypothetical protein
MTQHRIKVTGKAARRLDPNEVAKALGAQPFPVVFEGTFEIESEDDGGQALVAAINSPTEPQMFVRVQSWDETVLDAENERNDVAGHGRFCQFLGRKVRITLEVLE